MNICLFYFSQSISLLSPSLIETIGYLIDNDISYARTAHLTYLDGSSGRSALRAVTNANRTSLYRQRQIQAGCRFIF